MTEGRSCLRDVLDAVASREQGPGAGWAAAVGVGMGAALAGVAARTAVGAPGGQAGGDCVENAELLARQADRMRRRAGELADADADATRRVRRASAPRFTPDAAPWRARLAAALADAADAPLAVAELGAEVTRLAAALANAGPPAARADARVAATLAEAGSRAAAALVAVNVAAGGLAPDRAEEARRHAAGAADALARATAGVGAPVKEDDSHVTHP
jgi:formiminotetrahydrofolate cyclodeaminase